MRHFLTIILILFFSVNLLWQNTSLLANISSGKEEHVLDSLLNVYRKTQQDTIRLKVLLEIGDFYEQKNTDSVLLYYNKVINLSDEYIVVSPEKVKSVAYYKTTAQRYVGIIYLNIGEYKDALRWFETALNQANTYDLKQVIADCYNNLGLVYLYLGDYKNAIENYNKALNISQSIGNKKTIAQSYNSIGNVFYSKGDYENALEYYYKSLRIYEFLKNKNGLSRCYNNIGNLFSEKGDYEKAIDFFNKSLQIDISLDDKKGVADSYTNIGLIYYYQGSFEKATEHFFNALKMYEKLDDKKGQSDCYTNIGIVQFYQKNFDKALTYFQNSLKIKEEINDKRGISECYNNIGNVYFFLGNNSNDTKSINAYYNDAASYYLNSLKIDEELEDKNGISACYTNIGIIYKNQGNRTDDKKLMVQKYGESIDLFNKALIIKEKLGDKNGISVIYENIASVHMLLFDFATGNEKTNHIKKALEYGLKAFNLATEIGALPEQNSSAEFLRQAYTKNNNFKEALKYAEIYIATRDTMFSDEKTKALAIAEEKFESEKKQLQIEKLKKEKQLQTSEILRQQETSRRQKLVIVFVIFGLIMITVFLFFVVNRLRVTRRQKLIIEDQKKEIDDSIHYAKRIQQAVLPDLSVITRKPQADEVIPNSEEKIASRLLAMTVDYFILFRPKDVVSGDFYWATNVNEWFIACVADCTGHGVPGAFMSMLGISFLNEIVRKKEVIRANHILNELRKSIIEALKQTGESGTQKDGMDISLIAINTTPQAQTSEGSEAQTFEGFNPSKVLWAYAVQWAGANNPLWVIRPKSQDPRPKTQENPDTTWNLEFEICFLELKGDKMPIAIYERVDEFTNHELQLFSEDIIYLKSDGYEDQFGGPKSASGGKKFLSKNLKQLLIDNCRLPMNEQKEILKRSLEEWMGNKDQTDDITILGMKM